MGDNKPDIEVEELTVSRCWELLRIAVIGRLAVWVDEHPDIFPLNYAIDHGTVVFRTRDGTKIAAALSDAGVALEVDGYDTETAHAWSVVVKGRAEEIRGVSDLMNTVDLPIFPWQAGEKNRFVRILPTTITGRRFPVADPDVWNTSLSKVRRSAEE